MRADVLKFNGTRPTNLNWCNLFIPLASAVRSTCWCIPSAWPCLGNEPMDVRICEKNAQTSILREWFVPPFTVHNEKIECCKVQRWMKDWILGTRAAINFIWKLVCCICSHTSGSDFLKLCTGWTVADLTTITLSTQQDSLRLCFTRESALQNYNNLIYQEYVRSVWRSESKINDK